jgi:two-component system chemotaxis sensor kinase CheA
VLITVKDDGQGINPARVARKAVERRLIPPEAEESVDMQRAIELVFAPGFSTADATTDVSGRGVGMDAVDSMVRALGGDVIVTSELGVGTTAQVRLPLTLAIISALLVLSRDLPFALPLERVERTFRLSEATVRSAGGQNMLVLRDGAIPLFDLAAELGYGSSHERTHGVIVQGADRRIAIEVDSLVGQRELVTRPLPEEVGTGAALSGGAVLSSGDIALVVDCDALITNAWGPGSRL